MWELEYISNRKLYPYLNSLSSWTEFSVDINSHFYLFCILCSSYVFKVNVYNPHMNQNQALACLSRNSPKCAACKPSPNKHAIGLSKLLASLLQSCYISFYFHVFIFFSSSKLYICHLISCIKMVLDYFSWADSILSL